MTATKPTSVSTVLQHDRREMDLTDRIKHKYS